MSVRDPDYEDQFLAEAERVGQARHNVPTDGFAIRVRRRLRMGQELYGDSQPYQMMPPAKRALEISEEAEDAAAYAVLDAQIRLATNTSDDHAAWHLHEIAVHAAAIHSHVRYLINED